jgi:hypothetical protein
LWLALVSPKSAVAKHPCRQSRDAQQGTNFRLGDIVQTFAEMVVTQAVAASAHSLVLTDQGSLLLWPSCWFLFMFESLSA